MTTSTATTHPLPTAIQICSNPDGLAAGDTGRLVSTESIITVGPRAGSVLHSFAVRRTFQPAPNACDHGAAKVYIDGCCTMAEILG